MSGRRPPSFRTYSFGSTFTADDARLLPNTWANISAFHVDEMYEYLALGFWPRRMKASYSTAFARAKKKIKWAAKSFGVTEQTMGDNPAYFYGWDADSALRDGLPVVVRRQVSRGGSTGKGLCESRLKMVNNPGSQEEPLDEARLVLTHKSRPGSREETDYERQHDFAEKIVPRKDEVKAIVLQVWNS